MNHPMREIGTPDQLFVPIPLHDFVIASLTQEGSNNHATLSGAGGEAAR